MARFGFGGVCLLLAGVLVGFVAVPAARAPMTFPIDITKTVHGYTIHIVGEITIDEVNRTASGQIHITVTDPNGVVVLEKEITFWFTWGSYWRASFPIPGARLYVTVGPSGLALFVQSNVIPRFVELRAAQLDRVR